MLGELLPEEGEPDSPELPDPDEEEALTVMLLVSVGQIFPFAHALK
jgi:hypothetical protein